MKPIRLSGHAKEQLFCRGTTEEEVIETIRTSTWQPARGPLPMSEVAGFVWTGRSDL